MHMRPLVSEGTESSRSWLCSEIFPPITSPSPSPSQYFGPPAEMWLCRAGNPPDTCGQPPLANKIN